MPNLVNRLVVSELETELRDAQGMLVVSFGGLTVKESEGLRGNLAAKGVQIRMVRNSLARLVLQGRGFEVGPEVLNGNTAIAYGKNEAAIHAAKIFSSPEVKKAGKVQVKAGVLEGQLLGPRDAAALADVPDRNTLNAKILGCLVGPPAGIVGALNAVPAGLVRLLQARADQLAAAAPAAEAPAAPAAT
jgi:large subunit ribosomal protein L10